MTYVLYRWESVPSGNAQYLVTSAGVWDSRVRLARNRGQDFSRLELARGTKELMLQMQKLARD